MYGDTPAAETGARPRFATTTVLFLCTHNSARSLMAEAIANRRAFRLDGPPVLRAFSAGDHPVSRPHPLTLDLLQAEGYALAFARPQDWKAYATAGAPRIDLILQVCDRDPEPPTPQFPGAPPIVRWPTPDPVAHDGGLEEKRGAFAACYRLLERRIGSLIDDIARNGPLDRGDPDRNRCRAAAIGGRVDLA